jgi:hypothetical protein
MGANLDAALKDAEVKGAAIVEGLLFAGLKDLIAMVPVQYQPLVVGLDAALEPALKSFLDAQVAKLQG